MPAKSMLCETAKKHPNADVLFVYDFSDGDEKLQIVANSENIYEVGDVVAIVTAPSVLKDQTKIKISNIRNYKSHGMAMGKSDTPVGTDLSKEFCSEAEIDYISKEKIKASMQKWPSIGSLFNIRKFLKDQDACRAVTYNGKVKLDGTNGGIQLLTDGSIVPQSRSRKISTTQDNLGFARWVFEREEYFNSVRDNITKLGCNEDVTLFGEYCGPGIQKRTASSQTEYKYFAVFAIQIGTEDPAFETDPEIIRTFLLKNSGEQKCNQTFVLPWEVKGLVCNFQDREKLELEVETINKIVLDIEKCDPWVKDTFGIEGLGEGIVMYPIIDGKTLIPKGDYAGLVFKAKGDKHKVVNSKNPAQIDPEFVETVDNFVNLFVTENRLEQIAGTVCESEPKHKKLTGNFIKAFSEDVHKESVAEREVSNLEWRQVQKAVRDKAVKWWTEYLAK